MGNSVWLFLSDVFAHHVAWIGGVLMLIDVIEKLIGKDIVVPRKWVWRAGVLLLFVALIQAWFDEHRNVTILISEKADLASKFSHIETNTDVSRHARFYFDNPQELKLSPLRPFRSSKVPKINVVFFNAGPGTVQSEANAAFVVVSIEEFNNGTVSKTYQDQMMKTHIKGGPSVQGQGGYFTISSDRITAKAATDLNNGKKAVCAIGVAKWSDATGLYQTSLDICYLVEPTGEGNWHSLSENNIETTRSQ